MGGLGSGRTSHLGAAGKCELWRSIDLADLKRMGLLKPIVGGRIRAIVWKTDDGKLEQLGVIPGSRGIRFVKRDEEGCLGTLFVPFRVTPTRFGGHRRWFECPGCRRRCRVLYGVNSLRCRRCRRLNYASQSEEGHWRAQRRARDIRRRLGASGDALDGPFPPKPRYMRWTTYERLRTAEITLQERWLAGVAVETSSFGHLMRRVRAISKGR